MPQLFILQASFQSRYFRELSFGLSRPCQGLMTFETVKRAGELSSHETRWGCQAVHIGLRPLWKMIHSLLGMLTKEVIYRGRQGPEQFWSVPGM